MTLLSAKCVNLKNNITYVTEIILLQFFGCDHEFSV